MLSSSAHGDLSLGVVFWGEKTGGLEIDRTAVDRGWGASQARVHSPQSPGPTRVGCPLPCSVHGLHHLSLEHGPSLTKV